MRKTILDRDITTEEVSNYLLGRDNLPKVMGRKLELQTKNWRDYTYRVGGNIQDAIWKGFGALEHAFLAARFSATTRAKK